MCEACPFDAIHIVDGVAVVDKKLVSLWKCVAACPRKLIEIVPYDMKHLIKCNSKDKGKDVMKACKLDALAARCVKKHASLMLLRFWIMLRILIRKNVPDAVHVRQNVRRKLFSRKN